VLEILVNKYYVSFIPRFARDDKTAFSVAEFRFERTTNYYLLTTDWFIPRFARDDKTAFFVAEFRFERTTNYYLLTTDWFIPRFARDDKTATARREEYCTPVSTD